MCRSVNTAKVEISCETLAGFSTDSVICLPLMDAEVLVVDIPVGIRGGDLATGRSLYP